MKELKKKATKTSILLILVAFSSCKAPTIKNQIRRVYSIDFNACFCQWYNLNEARPVTELLRCDDFYELNFPDINLKPELEYCNDLVGFNAQIWAERITPWANELRRYGEDTCK